jgi:hypothetical protein
MKRFAVSILGTLVVVLSLLALPSAAQASPFNGAGYYYAGGSQTFSGTDYVQGWGGNAYVAKPFVPNTPTGGVYDHAVTDLVVNETTSGIAGNAIEAGIAVNRNVWGDFNPHLFVCAWHNSVDNGCWTNGAAPGVGAAYISSVTLYGASPGTLTPSLTLFTPTDSSAYDAAFTSGTTTRSFYYGGAGYKFVSGVATTPGNVGSC